ncbi:bifunctional Ribosomal protein L29-L35/Ribosomal protein L29 [Babesia duncani]|uniref:Bifunctional Ribosomal protein L29-L35/Ribosomal protein L29 n=1 Tax=Babesia duncani TaxID=323732 RepID=A0AAD9PM29_9APIC|nr:bifunctional Ribosomal protein L29-L35/Ribosomal protein L29 [Babesia duncani]
MENLKAYQLRTKTDEELLQDLEALKREYATFRVSKVTATANSKLAKIKIIRKSIARILTVYNERKKSEARATFKNRSKTPLNLRPKLTRAKRKALTPKQLHLKTLKQRKRIENIPKRKYALLV